MPFNLAPDKTVAMAKVRHAGPAQAAPHRPDGSSGPQIWMYGLRGASAL